MGKSHQQCPENKDGSSERALLNDPAQTPHFQEKECPLRKESLPQVTVSHRRTNLPSRNSSVSKTNAGLQFPASRKTGEGH